MSLKLQNKEQFSKEVQELVAEQGGAYMDAVLELCERKEMEPSTVAKLLTKPIKDKIEVEAVDLHFIPGNHQKLPV